MELELFLDLGPPVSLKKPNYQYCGSLYINSKGKLSTSLDWSNHTVDGGLSFIRRNGATLMMLKQSPSRNQRAKSLKVKHALKIIVILAISIWFLYQVKQSYKKNVASKERPAQVSENGENEYQLLKIGRKHLKPRTDEEVELDDVENNVRENEGEENIEEIDGGDKEKSEEAEHDQLQDFIDEDDKDN